MIKKLFSILMILLLFSSCSFDSGSDNSSAGEGGSMARFTISDNHLYVVDSRKLRIFSIENPTSPKYLNYIDVGFDIETIFSKGKMLFIGSRWGMYIYSIEQPTNPRQLSYNTHVYSYDPVVADNECAYVTYNSTRDRIGQSNRLDIYDIRNPSNPVLIQSYSMTLPKGLAIKNKKLFVCDYNQVVVFDVSKPDSIKRITVLENIISNDIIVHDTLVLLIGDFGFRQYSYINDKFKFLSSIETQNE